MQAIVPNRPHHARPYAWSSIVVTPDPPSVGEVVTLDFPLANPGPEELVVERIDVAIAHWGIGARWEKLDPIGPFHLPPDQTHIEHAAVAWMPRTGGHRCVRASIFMRGVEQPCQVGRNLRVLHAAEHEREWRVPFRLGNPERIPAPIMLRFGGNDATAVDVAVRIGERLVRIDQPIWLQPHEEVDAELVLLARTNDVLQHVRTVEATILGRFIDGIQVNLLRPARVTSRNLQSPSESDVRARRELAFSHVW